MYLFIGLCVSVAMAASPAAYHIQVVSDMQSSELFRSVLPARLNHRTFISEVTHSSAG